MPDILFHRRTARRCKNLSRSSTSEARGFVIAKAYSTRVCAATVRQAVKLDSKTEIGVCVTSALDGERIEHFPFSMVPQARPKPVNGGPGSAFERTVEGSFA